MQNWSTTIRKFNRFELKYVIGLKEAEEFKAALSDFLLPDEFGGTQGRYGLSSLYFDSPKLRCYWEKENGIKFRRKLRIRRYENGEVMTETTPVFVEIKQRVDRVTQKRRAVLPYIDALRLCYDRQIPEYDPQDKEVIEEVFAFLWQYNLRPMSIVRYDRQAFVGSKYDIGLRVTFDTALSFQTHPLRLHEQPSDYPMLSQNQVVMEIKVNERMPYWLTELIAAHNLHMVRVSKYCRSIDAAQRMPESQWRSQLAETSDEVLSSSFTVYNPSENKINIPRKGNHRGF